MRGNSKNGPRGLPKIALPLRSQMQGGDMGKVVGRRNQPAGYGVNLESKMASEEDPETARLNQ